MSETAYERGYRVGSSTSQGGSPTGGAGVGGGNFFTQRLGPLPMWSWMGIGLLGLLGVYLWKKNSTSSASTTTPGTTDSSLVPSFVNQVYNQEYPPNDGNTGTGNTTGQKVTVEDVVGESLEAGQDDLQGLGLSVKGFPFVPANAPKGSVRIITGQDPKAGSQVPKGTTITLTGTTKSAKAVKGKTTPKPVNRGGKPPGGTTGPA
jgi:hypothetical protein